MPRIQGTSPIHEGVEEWVREMAAWDEELDKTNIVPVGEEQLPPAMARERWGAMDKMGRRRLIQENGLPSVLRMLRGGRKNDAASE